MTVNRVPCKLHEVGERNTKLRKRCVSSRTTSTCRSLQVQQEKRFGDDTCVPLRKVQERLGSRELVRGAKEDALLFILLRHTKKQPKDHMATKQLKSISFFDEPFCERD